mgnify:CR=1 FL=1
MADSDIERWREMDNNQRVDKGGQWTDKSS